MKPLGMSIDLRVLLPSKTEDLIWSAVEDAVATGWTPARFKREVALSWDEAMKRESKEAQRILLGT